MCIEIDDNIELASRRGARDYWRRTTRLERDVLAAVRRGYPLLVANFTVRAIASAVLDAPASNRGLAVSDLFIDDDAEHARWYVLIELDNGNWTRAVRIAYPQ